MPEATAAAVVDQGHREQAETSPRTTLSVNGSQLRGLAYANLVCKEYENHVIDREKGSKLRPLARRLFGQDVYEIVEKKKAKLKKAIMDGDTKAATELAQGLAVPEQTSAQGLIDTLTADLTLDEVLDKGHDYEFLKSLQLPPHTEIPAAETPILLPDLGIGVLVDPDKNKFELPIRPSPETLRQYVTLPLDQQKLAWIDYETLEGPTDEALLSQLDVFGALAETTDTVYTHKTGGVNLPGFLSSEEFGNSMLRWESSGKRGLMVEKVSLGDADYYTDSIAKLNAGEEPAWRLVKQDGTKSFVHAAYIEAGRADEPILLFDKELPTRREVDQSGGFPQIIGKIRFDDPSLIGIWTSPTLRRHLLTWIDGWSEERKQKMFGDRNPGSILISSADQLEEKYRREPTTHE